MPGICGIIGTGLPALRASELQLMVKQMMHEPFYTAGTHMEEQLGVCAGWTAHQGSFADCLPFGMKRGISACCSRARISLTSPTSIELRTRGH